MADPGGWWLDGWWFDGWWRDSVCLEGSVARGEVMRGWHGSGWHGSGWHGSGQGRPRLTRRGRLVLLGFLLMVAGLAGALLAPASEAADPAAARPVTVVEPGDSLWSVAHRVAPGADPVATIEEIRRLNGLTGYTIYPGQRLAVPRR